MSRLRVVGVARRLAGRPVLRGVDLDVPSGAVLALLGASGSGKTTLLRVIAGFEPADEGRVEVDDAVLEAPGIRVPAERRRVGYVPQEGTLFPHLTVAANIGFGLTRAERAAGRIADMVKLTGLDGLERRYPHELSGGQQQRTALARALAPRPALVLLDEPFNALDMALRRSVCADVVDLLRGSGATAVLVTHDPQEAFASADLVAAMTDGAIRQIDTPAAIYRAPIDPDVARLTGPALFLDAIFERTACGRTRATTVLGPVAVGLGVASPGPGRVMVRPEQVVRTGDGGVVARVLGTAFRGDHSIVRAEVGGIAFDVRGSGLEPAVETLRLGIEGQCVAYAAERADAR